MGGLAVPATRNATLFSRRREIEPRFEQQLQAMNESAPALRFTFVSRYQHDILAVHPCLLEGDKLALCILMTAYLA